MTNKEFHIGIDLALKMFNHNLLGRLLSEEKDYIINKAINDLVHKTAEDARHSIINTESYADITSYYNVLEPYIITRLLEFIENKGRYNEYSLPKFVDVLNRQGNEIIIDTEYKVEQVGNLNAQLALITYSVPLSYIEDDILILSLANVVFIEYLVDDEALLDIIEGIKYKIIKADGLDFTPYGATNNNVGTIFTATANHTFSITMSTTDTPTSVLECISYTPPTWTDIELITIKSLSIFDYITANALISTNAYVTKTNNVKIIKGKYYRVSTAGAFTNLTAFGAAYNTVELNYIFVATASGTLIWSNGSLAVIEQLIDSTCRLVKPQDITGFLDHAYGTTMTSPLATIGDGKLNVYHDNKYNVVQVELVYVRPPATIDSVTNKETDLNRNLHPRIVTLAVEDIVSTNNPQLYQTVNAQEQKQKS